MHKKSTGKVGYLRFNDQGATEIRLIFPNTKPEIEYKFGCAFVRAINKTKLFLTSSMPIKNEENDFDFTLNTSVGKKYLELMEIAPKQILDKGGHSNVPNHYNSVEFAHQIFAEIDKKTKKYGVKKKPLFLLIYSTNFKLNLSELVIIDLKYLLNSQDHCFEMVFYCSMLDEHECSLRILYPSEINDFDESKYSDNVTINMF